MLLTNVLLTHLSVSMSYWHGGRGRGRGGGVDSADENPGIL